MGRLGAQPASVLPDRRRFQSGDLVWPKKPGAYILYNSGDTTDRERDERRWLAERDRCVTALKREPRHFTPAAIEALANLSFAEFHARYTTDPRPDGSLTYSDGAVAIGHVGIIDIDAQGTPWIVEAILEGVVRKTYDKWLQDRPGEVVWHGRLKQPDPSVRAGIATYARRHIGKPYDFWNFDLSDESGFYCSKLVWLSAYRTFGAAVDGNANPKRHIWFSPKQLMNAEGAMVLYAPGGPY